MELTFYKVKFDGGLLTTGFFTVILGLKFVISTGLILRRGWALNLGYYEAAILIAISIAVIILHFTRKFILGDTVSKLYLSELAFLIPYFYQLRDLRRMRKYLLSIA